MSERDQLAYRQLACKLDKQGAIRAPQRGAKTFLASLSGTRTYNIGRLIDKGFVVLAPLDGKTGQVAVFPEARKVAERLAKDAARKRKKNFHTSEFHVEFQGGHRGYQPVTATKCMDQITSFTEHDSDSQLKDEDGISISKNIYNIYNTTELTPVVHKSSENMVLKDLPKTKEQLRPRASTDNRRGTKSCSLIKGSGTDELEQYWLEITKSKKINWDDRNRLSVLAKEHGVEEVKKKIWSYSQYHREKNYEGRGYCLSVAYLHRSYAKIPLPIQQRPRISTFKELKEFTLEERRAADLAAKEALAYVKKRLGAVYGHSEPTPNGDYSTLHTKSIFGGFL